MKLTDAETIDVDDVKIRKEYLHRLTLDDLIEKVCGTSKATDPTQCLEDSQERDYIHKEVAKLEFMLSLDGETNIKGSFIDKPGVVNKERLIYDIWYKRIATDILLYRER